MATPPPQEHSEVEEMILSQQCYWHCWCAPLILPFPLHCPAEQNQLGASQPCATARVYSC